MAKVKQDGDGRYSFVCPGCGNHHTFGPGWTFNGNLDSPTFSPSLLVRSGHYVPGHEVGDHCWCSFNAERESNGEEPSVFECYLCHSFVTDGKIQFLGDCTHALAGQTIDLPEIKLQEVS